MKTNHYVRVVTLATGERVLCLFGEVRDENGGVSGYRMAEPFNLTLGDPDDKGNMPIKYNRWCMFSPEREYRLSGIHIVAVSFPEETILDTYVEFFRDDLGEACIGILTHLHAWDIHHAGAVWTNLHPCGCGLAVWKNDGRSNRGSTIAQHVQHRRPSGDPAGCQE